MSETGGPPYHLIDRAQLALLYEGRSDRAVVETLWRTQRSRRLLLLNMVIDAIASDAAALGPLPPIEGPVAALEAAEAADPQAFRQVLLLPTVGSWAAYALRRLHGFVSAETPLWIDAGLIHVLALVASFRASVDWATVVPLRDGRVMLPGLGMISFPNAPSVGQAEVVTTAGRLSAAHDGREVVVGARVANRTHDDWWPLRRLRTSRSPVLTLVLDDIDPFRELAEPVDPDRLPAEEVIGWSDLLEGAWRTICDHHPLTAEAIAVGLVSVTPIPHEENAAGTSGSTGEAFGALLVTRPSSHLGLAVALVHEFAHVQLGGLLHLLDMTHTPDPAVHYAPWRDDPRPMSGLLQGIYAFTAIAAFWRKQASVESGPAAARARFEYAYARGQVARALATAMPSTLFTAAGRELVDGLARRVGAWEGDVVPAVAARAAGLALDAHRAGWRIRNVRPDGATVRGLAQAWIDRRAAPGVEQSLQIAQGADSLWSQERFRLIQDWVAVRALGRTAAPPVARAGPADLALLAGELEAAGRQFCARIGRDADDLDAWTGLGLAAQGAARMALTEYPAVVRAVHCELVRTGDSPDLISLASWVGRGSTQAGAVPNVS